jgi:hypothetical protein
MQASRVAIAVLSFRPDARQIQFYETLADYGYSVFAFADDDDFVIPPSRHATYLKIDKQTCVNRGYFLMNPMIAARKSVPVSAWERALCFFGMNHRKFDHVWFFEDDVFIPRAETIPRIDRRYPDADMLCGPTRVNHFGEVMSWEWWTWVPKDILPLPWACALVCASRVSGRLLAKVDRTVVDSADKRVNYALQARDRKGPEKFLFIEFLLNTVALHHKLKVAHPPEFATVHFRRPWRLDEVDDRLIYHPVKAISEHDAWRTHLASKRAQGSNRGT